MEQESEDASRGILTFLFDILKQLSIPGLGLCALLQGIDFIQSLVKR